MQNIEYKEKIQPARSMGDSADKDKTVVDKVKGWKTDVEGWVSAWESSQNKWHKLRMRIKRKKTFPFVGCSNIRMPTIEIKIRKLKAALVNVIFGIRPVVQVVPAPSGSWEDALKIEKWLDHLLMDKMETKNKAIIAIDQALERGFFVMKPHWRTELTTRIEKLSLDDISMEEAQWLFSLQTTPEQVYPMMAQRLNADMSPMVIEENQIEIERVVEQIYSGKSDITVTLKDVLYDAPDISLIPPERLYVPTTTGFDPQGAEYLIHEFYLPLCKLKQNAEGKGWDGTKIEGIDATKNTDLDNKSTDLSKDTREGIQRLQGGGELVKIWECYCWDDINGDGVKEKAVITIAPDFDKLLRKISLPFHSGQFPFVKLFYELINDRWFSHRGIPELIEDIVKEIDISHMQKIDYQTVANSPMFLYRAGQISRKSQQFAWGQGIPVNAMANLDDVIKPFNRSNSNIEFSYEREQMMLETKVEELTGQIDFTLQSQINKRQPRTLGEVELQNQNMQQVFSLDADMFREQFAKLFNWVFDLWAQYGDEEVTFRYLGQSTTKEGELIHLSREALQAKYKITVRGNDQNTNPQVKMQKAQAMAATIQNPLLMQTGVMTPVHVANVMKRYYQMLDVPNWEELVNTPEQIMQQMQQQQQNEPPPPDDIKLKGDDLTDKEMAQALQKRGIQPDAAGRFLNEQNRRQQLEIEQEGKGFEALSKILNTVGKQTADKPKKGAAPGGGK